MSKRVETTGDQLAPPLGDDDVLIAFHKREMKRWRKRAERDAAMARTHERYAQEAEYQLALIYSRQSKASR